MKKTSLFFLFILLFVFLCPAWKRPAGAEELALYGIKLSKVSDFVLNVEDPVRGVFTGSVLPGKDQIITYTYDTSKILKEKGGVKLPVSYFRLNLYDINKPKPVWTSPLINEFENAYAWGDLNNDNSPSMFIFYPGRVEEHHYNGKKMVKKSFNLPVKYYTKQALIGDVDNDGRNELVAFLSDKTTKVDSSEKLSLIIYKCDLGKSEFNAVYFGTFSYAGGSAPDKLVCISDIYNIKSNKLVILHGQSGISPSQYKILSFQGGKLYKEKIIDQANNISALELENTPPNPDWLNKIINEFSILGYDGKNYLLAQMLPQTERPSFTMSVNELTEKRLINYAQIKTSSGADKSWIMPINTGDKNSGILYFTENGKAVIYKIESL